MLRAKNQYVFITLEGETAAPNPDCEVENCQVLGIVYANNEKEAREKLLTQNPWIEQAGFDRSCMRCIQILTKYIRSDIFEVVNYLWRDEERHWEECKDRKDHIFYALKRLSKI